MKKFFMYVIVLVTLLFVGYTVYYFVQNNETISSTLGEENQIFLNVGETCDLPILWTKPYSSTKVYDDENVAIGDKEVLTYDSTTKTLVAKAGGNSTVTVTPSNKKFGPFMFTVVVGDGSTNFPYYIQNDVELASIGKENNKFTLNDSYKLVKDIDLKSYSNWTPIGNSVNAFAGNFDGNNRVISNLTLSEGSNVGLFGEISSISSISNLTLNKVTINGEFDNAGSIVAVSRGTVRLCKVFGLDFKNTKADSNNGGVVGYCENLSVENKFTQFAYVDMCSVSLTAESAGYFGGLVGKLVGSVVYNSKCIISNFVSAENTIAFGGLVGIMENAKDTDEYMFSVIKNDLVIINRISPDKVAAVVGEIVDDTDPMVTYGNVIKNVYYATNVDNLKSVLTKNKEVDYTSSIHFVSSDDLEKQETFQNWNFEFVWTTFEDTAVVDINYETAVAQSLDEYIPGAQITNADELMAVLDSIRVNPANPAVYEITQTFEIDLNGAEWDTIAPEESNPMKTSLICVDDNTVTFKNFKISTNTAQRKLTRAVVSTGENSSFFGYISGVNTQVKGLIFENVTVNLSSTNVGVIATSVLDNATIDSCKVNYAEITTGSTTSYIGVIAGKNYGKIINCSVLGNEETEDGTSKVVTNGKKVVVGGLVGENHVLVSNSTISAYSFSTINDVDALIYFGGIVAYSDGSKILNCYCYDCCFKGECLGSVFAGGVCGEITNTTVEKSFADGILVRLPYSNEKTFVGGIVGYMSGSVLKFSYCDGIVEGYYVGGIAGYNTSTIDQCYFHGEVTGMQVAGLVSMHFGSITNCSTQGNIIGKSVNSTASGLVSKLPKGSSCEYCFCNLNFDKCEGTSLYAKNAETETEFRSSETEGFLNEVFNFILPERYTEETGELRHCIIINYGSAEIKTGAAGKGKFIECDDNQAKGLSGGYSVFKNDAGFDQTIWTFDNNNGEGAYPTLTNVVKDPRVVEVIE